MTAVIENKPMPTQQHVKQVFAEADCIYTAEQVSNALDVMAKQIAVDYADAEPLLIGILNGGAYVTTELMRRLTILLQLDFLQVQRYRNQTYGGELQWRLEPVNDLSNRHVLIVDDILDEGLTLKAVIEYCKSKNPVSVEVAILSHKQRQVAQDLDIKYCGLELPNRYVFGCGMDYQGYFRNLNSIYAI